MEAISFTAFYKLLNSAGFPRPSINGEGMPPIAWPDSKTGITFGGEDIPPGWEVVRLEGRELVMLTSLLSRITLLNVSHRLRLSGGSATRKISSDEQEMLGALMQVGLPDPDRNYTVRDDNGAFRGVTDFAWEFINGIEIKVAIEIDGWHWHVGRDMAEEIATLAGTDKTVQKGLQNTVRAKGAVDAAKRRVLQQRGWQVIVIHDTEITPKTLDDIAQDVASAINYRMKEGSNATPAALNDQAGQAVVGDQFDDKDDF